MSNVTGMDTGAVRALAASFKSSASRLSWAQRELDVIVFAMGWWGPNSDAFRDQWSGQLRRGVAACVEALDDAGSVLLQNVQEQERASDVSAGRRGLHEWLRTRQDDAAEVIHGVRDGAAKAIDWVGDRVEDGLAWSNDRIEDGKEVVLVVRDHVITRVDAFLAGLGPLLKSWGVLGRMVLDTMRGRPPQAAEVLAALILIAGTTAGVVGNVVTGRDLDLFDDGEPWTGTAHEVPSVSKPRRVRDLTETIAAAVDHNGVVITVVRRPEEPPRYIVSIPGTSADFRRVSGYTGDAGGKDMSGNVWAMASGSSTYSRAIEEALDKVVAADRAAHGEPDVGRPAILLAGFSQGGLVAANLAADGEFRSRYHVLGVVGFGAPMDCAPVPQGTPVLSIQDIDSDPVPSTDLGGFGLPRLEQGPNAITVRTESPAEGPFGAHSLEQYRDGVAAARGADAEAISKYEAKLNGFFFSDAEHVTSWVVETGRTTP